MVTPLIGDAAECRGSSFTKGRGFGHLLSSIGVLRHPCDLDLLLFFHHHPRSLLTSERLAAYVGYDPDQVGRSIEVLTGAGLLKCSHNPASVARMYLLQPPASGWLASLVTIVSTGEGRRSLLEAMKRAPDSGTSADRSGTADAVAALGRRATMS